MAKVLPCECYALGCNSEPNENGFCDIHKMCQAKNCSKVFTSFIDENGFCPEHTCIKCCNYTPSHVIYCKNCNQ